MKRINIDQSGSIETRELPGSDEYMYGEYGRDREIKWPKIVANGNGKQIIMSRKRRQLKMNKIKWQGILSGWFSIYHVYQTDYLVIWRNLFQETLKKRRKQNEGRKNTHC